MVQLWHRIEQMCYKLGTVTDCVGGDFSGCSTKTHGFRKYRSELPQTGSHLWPMEKIIPRLLKFFMASITPVVSGAAVMILTAATCSLPMSQSS